MNLFSSSSSVYSLVSISRKATISFVTYFVSLRPFVGMEQLGSHRTDFNKICYLSFRKSVGKDEVLLKYNENKGYVT